MNALKVYQAIGNVVASYNQKLDAIAEDVFVTQPPIGGWSYSEVYSHIFDASLLSLMALQKAANGEGDKGATPFAVRLILFLGFLPPMMKFKVPNRMAGRVKKITKMAARQFIVDFELQLTKNYPKVTSAVANSKVKHPKMGYLDAKQWLRFIEIHLKHHLKQIERIEKSYLEP